LITETDTYERPTVVALYLPQFHPIPENDEWWGTGFTEWTNVAKARPLFRGHYQPNLPADLGFYDLRVPETRAAQARLAMEYGVNAFCYYHYWFGDGRRLLERPFEDVLTSGEPDFPFMLCWANQTWSGIWHGLENRVLVEQRYPGPKDHEAHFAVLLRAFKDPRYLRVNNKPVFMVYSPLSLPEPRKTLNLWRSMAAEAGLDGLYLLAEHSDPFWDAGAFGFDAFVNKRSFKRRRSWIPWSQPFGKIKGKILDSLGRPSIYNYDDLIDYFIPKEASELAIPCTLPNWDNTPRSGARGVVLKNSTPELFSKQLQLARERLNLRHAEDNLLFIKSWNEWAEGNILEPDRRFGHAYLEAIKNTLN
jgi:Glycosyltransferase WbsX